MKYKFNIQLFANTSTKGGSASSSHSDTTSYSEGGSSSHSEGGSHSHTESDTHTEGGSHSESYGKSWWSGQVEENTKKHRDAYNTDYEEGAKVTDAYERLQETLNNKPTFQSKYESKLEELYNSIMGREKFKYNFNADPMYQMYKDQYVAQGKQAMEDSMGKAQAMNGGYGSSYSQSAAQQQYQNYLQNLNNMIPTLRDQAFEQYQYEGQEMLNKYGITADAYDREYGHYRDDVADWQSDRSFNQGMYADERNFDYSQFTNERAFWNDEYWKERQSETSNYQTTDSNYWEDSHTTSDTDTSFWEDTNSTHWNSSSSHSNNSAATSSWSGSQSAAKSGAGSSSSSQSPSVLGGFKASNPSGNSNNNYSGMPSSKMAAATNEEITETVRALNSMSAAEKARAYKELEDEGLSKDDIEYLKKLAETMRKEGIDWKSSTDMLRGTYGRYLGNI